MESQDSLSACEAANARLMVTIAQLAEAGNMVIKAKEAGLLIPLTELSSSDLKSPQSSTGSPSTPIAKPEDR